MKTSTRVLIGLGVLAVVVVLIGMGGIWVFRHYTAEDTSRIESRIKADEAHELLSRLCETIQRMQGVKGMEVELERRVREYNTLAKKFETMQFVQWEGPPYKLTTHQPISCNSWHQVGS